MMVSLYYIKMLVHKPTYFKKMMIKDFRVYLTSTITNGTGWVS